MASPPGKPDSCPEVLVMLIAVFTALTWAAFHLTVRIHRRKK